MLQSDNEAIYTRRNTTGSVTSDLLFMVNYTGYDVHSQKELRITSLSEP